MRNEDAEIGQKLDFKRSRYFATFQAVTLSQLTGNGGRQFLAGIRSYEAGESVRRVAVEVNEGGVGWGEKLRRLSTAAVGEDATGVVRRGTVTERHRVEARPVLHRRLEVKVFERQQHFLQQHRNNSNNKTTSKMEFMSNTVKRLSHYTKRYDKIEHRMYSVRSK